MTAPATMTAEGDPQPRVSVVIPVFNGGPILDQCLSALARSTYPLFETILVDDASTDGNTEAVARKHGAKLIGLEARRGPAAARNSGVSAARGEIIFFTDADVLLDPDAVGIAVGTLSRDAQLGAVFGSYDDAPGYPDFLSQYRNLYHHWVHQAGNPEASTFWTGCGAIWRHVFVRLGGFTESYDQPSIEDIELGARLRASGLRIRLEKTMLGKHMKQWRLWNLVTTDLFRRGVPWMVLVLRQRQAPTDLNLNLASRTATVLAALFALSLVALVTTTHASATWPAMALLAAGVCSAWLTQIAPRRSVVNALAPAVAVVATLGAIEPASDPWALLPLALITALVLIQLPFYRYLAQKRGGAFALAAIPMQLLFFLCCACAIPLGMAEFYRSGGTVGARPQDTRPKP